MLVSLMVLMLGSLSCVSLITDIGASAILDISPQEVRDFQKTLDPKAELSKRTAIALMTATMPGKLDQLNEKMSGTVNSVIKPQNDGVVRLTVPVTTGEVQCYIMYPKGYRKGDKLPTIFFSHGGGFEMGDYNSYSFFCKEIVKEANAILFFYDYSLAPEYKFPHAVNETWDIYNWLLKSENSEKYGIDMSNVVLMGDSAGGNFAAGLAIRLAENKLPLPKGVILMYPAVDLSDNMTYSKLAFSGAGTDKHKYLTTLSYLASVLQTYLENPQEDPFRPYASPLIMLMGLIEVPNWNNKYEMYQANLKVPLDYFPPHFIVLPEIDSLTDDGKMYNAVLRILGAESTFKVYKGNMHAFSMMTGFIGGATDSVRDSAAYIKEWTK